MLSWGDPSVLSLVLQIVRTDLKELRDFNLDGAPYGYTPFCESRREMDGYRFWKSGYWASHLAGRKYHIRYDPPPPSRLCWIAAHTVSLVSTCLIASKHTWMHKHTFTPASNPFFILSCIFHVFPPFILRSALYVVDLKKFRKIAAGDRLRGQYQGLSQDPNSLSNLDQVCDRPLSSRLVNSFRFTLYFSER